MEHVSSPAFKTMEVIRDDISELNELRKQAKRGRTQNVLDDAINQAQNELEVLESEEVSKLKKETEAATTTEIDPEENQPPPPPLAAEAAPSISQQVPIPPIKGGYVSINCFGFDAGGSNHAWVELYISLEDVGTVKDSVECEFKKDSFDLTIRGLKGKNYRLLKSNLEHDIVAEDSKFIVKKNKVVIKLKKVKGDYSYDSWQNLTSKKNKEAKAKSKNDPTAGIMDMMKDMYDGGDDQMKKVIGEAMMKSKQGQGAGGMGGL